MTRRSGTIRRALVRGLPALSIAAGPAVAQELDALDAYVAQAVEAWDVPGLAMAVVKDGEVVFEDGYGVLRLGDADPVSAHTRFAIGSTTKAMTSAAIGMLVDDGVLDWDDRVTEHLPDFELQDPYVTREVTVRDLLTHRAGLGNADFLWYGQDLGREEILHRLRFLAPETSMRSNFTYQNIMYAAAGAVIEAVTGHAWEEVIRSRILEPLGMSETIALLSRAATETGVAAPHDRVDGAVTVIENASVDAVAPAGSIWSSVHDMALWLRFLLAGGVTEDGERLLEEQTHAELFTPQMIIRPDQFYPTARLTRPHWTTYGLGWFQSDYAGRAVDFHTGSIDGMVAIAGLIRDEGLGIVVLGNLDHAEVRHALMYRVFDLFGPDEPRDWSAELLELYGGLDEAGERRRAAAERERVTDTAPSLRLSDYAGEYTDPLYGTIRVTLEDEGLRLGYGPGLQGRLEHWHYDTFRVLWDAAWRGRTFVSFTLGRIGTASAIEMNGARFSRLEAP